MRIGCKGRSKETSYEATAIMQVREDGGSGKGRGRQILDVFLRQSQQDLLRLEVECERKKSEDERTCFGIPSSIKTGKNVGRMRLGKPGAVLAMLNLRHCQTSR